MGGQPAKRIHGPRRVTEGLKCVQTFAADGGHEGLSGGRPNPTDWQHLGRTRLDANRLVLFPLGVFVQHIEPLVAELAATSGDVRYCSTIRGQADIRRA